MIEKQPFKIKLFSGFCLPLTLAKGIAKRPLVNLLAQAILWAHERDC
jgi:hypothetical protein